MNQKQLEKEARRVVEGGEADQQSQKQGDDRTPEKTIGQVKYAEGGGEREKQGGSTRTSPEDRGVVRNQKGQEHLPDKKPAQQSQTEGPAAYAPHRQDEVIRANPGQPPEKKKTGEF